MFWDVYIEKNFYFELYIFIRVRAVKQRRPCCIFWSYYYYSRTYLRNLGYFRVDENSQILVCASELVSSRTKFAARLRHAQTHKTPIGLFGAGSTGSWPFWVILSYFWAILPFSTPRIWSNSSYKFNVDGFKLGVLTLNSWGIKTCDQIFEIVKGVSVADPQTLTTHHCSPQNTFFLSSLITFAYIVPSSPNFIGLPGTLIWLCTYVHSDTHL